MGRVKGSGEGAGREKRKRLPENTMKNGLIQDGLFTNWKIRFDSDPQLHDLKLLVLKLFHFAI